MLKAVIIGAKILLGRSLPDLSLEEMIYRAVKATLDQTGISIEEVDQIAIASSDGLDGRAISPMVTTGSVGAYQKRVINSSSSGEHALVLGALQIMAGRSRLCLVANWAKPSETSLRELDRLQTDPFFYRSLPLSRVELLGLQSQAMAAGAPVGKEWIQRMESIRGRVPNASPDGVVVIILAKEDVAKSKNLPYTSVSGFGWGTDTYWRGGKELAELRSLAKAADRAYQMVSIDDPSEALDFIETMDFTPVHLLNICRALRLCEADSVADFAERLAMRTTKIQINPSDCVAVRDLDFATGLAVVVSTHQRLLIETTIRKAERPSRGLAHVASSNAAQTNSVFILEGAGDA